MNIINTLRNSGDLEEAFLLEYKSLIGGADVLWIDKLVSFQGMEWTMEHLSTLVQRMRFVLLCLCVTKLH